MAIPSLTIPEEEPAIFRKCSDIRGVDYSTPIFTQTNTSRSPFCANMFNDNLQNRGSGLRTRFGLKELGNMSAPTVLNGYGYYLINYKDKVLIRFGIYLLDWNNYPVFTGLEIMPHGSGILDGDDYNIITDELSFYSEGQEDKQTYQHVIFNGLLYIYDGNGIYVYDGNTIKCAMGGDSTVNEVLNASIYPNIKDIPDNVAPTIYLQVPSTGAGDNPYLPKNLASNMVRIEFKAENGVKTYNLPITSDNIKLVRYEFINESDEKKEYINPNIVPSGYITSITLSENPKADTNIYAVVLFDEDIVDYLEVITNMRTIATYDNRVFLAGNDTDEYASKDYINKVIHSQVNDPLYFPDNAFYEDSAGDGKIMALLPVGNSLAVIKEDVAGRNAIYIHTSQFTTNTDLSNLTPKFYPSTYGMFEVGCVNRFCACNFNDEAIFLSRTGVKAIASLDLLKERAIEHRSTMIDSELLKFDLSKAFMTTWGNYLLIFVEDNIFIADSRKTFTNDNTGTSEYEWFHWKNICRYINMTDLNTVPEIALPVSAIAILSNSRADSSNNPNGDLVIMCSIKKGTGFYRYCLVFDGNSKTDVPFTYINAITSVSRLITPPIFSYIATIYDDFGYPNRYKKTNQRGGIVNLHTDFIDDLKLYVKTAETPYKDYIINPNMLNDNEPFYIWQTDDTKERTKIKRTDTRLVFRIKEKKWNHISLMFQSDMPFTLFEITLEAFIKNYTRK